MKSELEDGFRGKEVMQGFLEKKRSLLFLERDLHKVETSINRQQNLKHLNLKRRNK